MGGRPKPRPPIALGVWDRITAATLIAVLLLSASRAKATRSTAKRTVRPASGNPVIPRSVFLPRPVSSWFGERFVFLNEPPSLQKYDYLLYTDDEGDHPSYRHLAGKTVYVTSVSQDDDSDWKVTLRLEGTSETFTTTTNDGAIDQVAPVKDIEVARKLWLGRTLWYVRDNMIAEDGGPLYLKKFSPVKVLQVTSGWESNHPVRFIVKVPNGRIGYIDTAVSGTNTSSSLRETFAFSRSFLTSDPRRTFPWPSRVWSIIECGKVFIGMTDQQVLMSRGRPSEVNRTTTADGTEEQWVYPHSYFYFDNGRLTTVQQ